MLLLAWANYSGQGEIQSRSPVHCLDCVVLIFNPVQAAHPNDEELLLSKPELDVTLC